MRNQLLKLKTKPVVFVLLMLLSAGVVVAQTPAKDAKGTKSDSGTAAQPAGKKNVDPKNSFKEYELGQDLSSFTEITKVRPNRSSIIGKYEEKCTFYNPKQDIKIGDFTVEKKHVYLIFFNKKLMRVRIYNMIGSFGNRDLKFYQALLAALTTKYGQVKSTEPLWTPYAGEYSWKTRKITVKLRFEKLVYTHIATLKALRATFDEGERINPSDL